MKGVDLCDQMLGYNMPCNSTELLTLDDLPEAIPGQSSDEKMSLFFIGGYVASKHTSLQEDPSQVSLEIRKFTDTLNREQGRFVPDETYATVLSPVTIKKRGTALRRLQDGIYNKQKKIGMGLRIGLDEERYKHFLRDIVLNGGTVRPNRKGWSFPSSKQKAGEIKMKKKGVMVAVQWTDKRQVNVLSTNSDPKMVAVKRRSKQGMI
ncbi:PiggyBac transposable element-derived protein 4-like [Plakobranchus ocellatus]|uniref:PiggyBac transposable element-derived protein 4-like n=1 Tax=Plakobranchus ocellatus TaxID=259542 RepID=A0AAV4D5X6_9GAST|nr:PiggyBac transposable element-derived protein 4-like [Plakobranchus ocellatus]